MVPKHHQQSGWNCRTWISILSRHGRSCTDSQFDLPSAAPFSLHISCQYQFYAPGAPGLQPPPFPSLVVFSRSCQRSAILHRYCAHCLSTPHFQSPRAQQPFSALVSRFPACTLVTFKSNSFFSAAKPGARPDLATASPGQMILSLLGLKTGRQRT